MTIETKGITVAELIEILQTKPQHLLVLHDLCSDYCLFGNDDIFIVKLCEPRPDGVVQFARPDKPLREYLYLG